MRWLSNETFYSAFVARIQRCRDAPSGNRPKSQPSTSVLRREQGAIDALQRELNRTVEVDEQYLVAMMQLGLLEV